MNPVIKTIKINSFFGLLISISLFSSLLIFKNIAISSNIFRFLYCANIFFIITCIVDGYTSFFEINGLDKIKFKKVFLNSIILGPICTFFTFFLIYIQNNLNIIIYLGVYFLTLSIFFLINILVCIDMQN